MSGVLPNDWQNVRLEDIAEEISYGYTAKAQAKGGGVQMLRITDIQNGRVDWVSVPFCDITSDSAARAKYSLRPGDLVFARTGATTGKSFLIRDTPNAVFASYLIRVRPSSKVDPAFLYHFFQSRDYWEQISDNVAGSAQPNCNASKLAQLDLPLPSVAEQQRIVAKLEEVLGRVRGCQERLDKVPKILKRFRQSVLATACSGRLTADWREQHDHLAKIDATIECIHKRRGKTANSPAQSARVKGIYQEIEEGDAGELPESWRFVRLSKLCNSFDYGTSAKSQPSGDIPVLRMGNIQNGEIDWTDLVYTSDSREIANYLLKPNTVLFNRTNSPELVGKTAIYRGERPAIFAGYLIRANPELELDAEYLNLCLNTANAKEFCMSVKTDGVSQSNINAQKLGAFELPFCSIEEQREIVKRVGTLFAQADRIAAVLDRARSKVSGMTPSLLAKAFKGELVSQYADNK